ncbi:MAG: cytochrome P450 [Granulosicoccus sp.]|nr:cytochrome P450 [Granulosicoccus sp.]
MTIWTPTDDGYADISDHDSFVNGVPHNTFSRLRKEQPLAWTDCEQHDGFWSVSRHADILELNRNVELLTSARGIRMEDQTHEEYLARRTFQETDPPEHTHTRMLVEKAFSRPVILKFEQVIRDLCDQILDQCLEKGSFDAASEIARQLPMRMLGQIIGVPEKDLDWLVTKGDELIGNTDPEFTNTLLDQDDTDAYRLMPFRSPAGAELWDYANELMAQKKAAGDADNVLSLIMQPNSQGETITPEEFRNFFCLLVAAGNDTTRYTLSASIHALARQQGLLEQLKQGGEDIWKSAGEEFIRWASPTMYFRRTATRDFEYHGQTVSEGQKVLLWFVSGNRDDAVFENPFCLDLLRTPNRHVSFGQGGPHVCLGMWLARLEVRCLLQEFVKRIQTVELAGEAEYTRSNFVGGLKRLPISVKLN